MRRWRLRRRGWLRLRRLPLIDPEGAAKPARPGKPRIKIRRLDVLIIALSAAALLYLSVMVYGGPPSSSLVVSTDRGEWIYPLSADRTIDAEGVLGVSVIHIEGGFAHFVESPCVNKLCIAAPRIGSTGQWSACLPNGVFIRIEGSEATDDIDAFVR